MSIDKLKGPFTPSRVVPEVYDDVLSNVETQSEVLKQSIEAVNKADSVDSRVKEALERAIDANDKALEALQSSAATRSYLEDVMEEVTSQGSEIANHETRIEALEAGGGGGGSGMQYYIVTYDGTTIKHNGVTQNYQQLVSKYNDPNYFLYAEAYGLTMIPSLPPMPGDEILEFICSWIYSGNVTISRLIINSSNQIKYENIEVSKQSELNSVKTTVNSKVSDVQVNGASILDNNKVANISYANPTTAGVIKAHNYYGLEMNNQGEMYSQVLTAAEYSNKAQSAFVSKGTLENRLTPVENELSEHETRIEALEAGGGGGGSTVSMTDNIAGGVDITVNTETRTLAKQYDLMEGYQLPNYVEGIYLDDRGLSHEDSRYIVSDYIDVVSGASITWYMGVAIPTRMHLCVYDANKNVIDYWFNVDVGYKTFTLGSSARYIRASFYKPNLIGGNDHITMNNIEVYKVGYRAGGLLGLNGLNEKVENMLKHIQVELCNNLTIDANANSPQIQLSSLLPAGFDMDRIVAVSTECTYTTGSWRCICNPMKFDNEYYFIIASIYGASSTVTFKANVYYI